MRTKIVLYNGFIAFLSSPEAEGVLFGPENGMAGGVDVKQNCIDITQEALDALNKVPAADVFSIPDFGSGVDQEQRDGNLEFVWKGGYKTVVELENATTIEDNDFTGFNVVESLEIPEDLKHFIDVEVPQLKAA